jgi:regulator of replication initiation timing
MGFIDFFTKMQQDGMEAAKKFWSSYPQKSDLFPNAIDLYERIVDFYIMLGIVPKTNYDNVLKENTSLKEENKFLKDILRELQVNIFKIGGEKAQEIWDSSIDKQLEVNKEIAKNFFELFRMLKGGME